MERAKDAHAGKETTRKEKGEPKLALLLNAVFSFLAYERKSHLSLRRRYGCRLLKSEFQERLARTFTCWPFVRT